jgi:tRNA(Ile)-lysidine synthase
VAVAVSGGLDSVCLLDLLVRTRGMHGGVLSVVTIDHGTREGSADDADFVVELARSLELPCRRHTGALGPGASEATCRALRREIWDALDVDCIALGHHQRDQAETAVLGVMRGGGSAAWSGMRWRSGRYVRPLLDVSPDAIASWAENHALVWREDPTNDSPRFLRNRVRHELLPAMRSLRQGVIASIARGAGHAAEDHALLERLSVEADPHDGDAWPVSWIAEGPSPLVRRALVRRLGEVGSGILDDIVDCARRGSGSVRVSEWVTVVVERNGVFTLDAGRNTQ